MMADHWKIGLICHTYLSMEMSCIKNGHHSLKWHSSISSDRLCILICSDILSDGRGRKRFWEGVEGRQIVESRQQLLIAFIQDLCWVVFGSSGGVHGCD